MPQLFSRLNRLAVFLALVVISLVLAAACGEDDKDTPLASAEPIERGADIPIVIPAGEPIVVGISTALTGGPVGVRGAEYRDAAVTSIERWKQQNGELIGGHEIEVRAEDDGCSASGVATVAAERLLALAGLVGVLGPQCSGGVAAVMDDYARAGIVMISGSATTTSLTDDQGEDGFFFRTAYRNDLEGTLIGLFLFGYENAYLIDDGGTYALDLGNSAAGVANDLGVSVTRRSITPGTVDFSALAEEIVRDNADIVGFGGFNPEAALLYRQLRDAGYTGIFGASDGAASVTGFIEPVGVVEAEGVFFAGCTLPLPMAFLDDFVELHGYEPTASFPAQYADAATILLNAVAAVAEEQADGSLVIEPAKLRDKVRGTATGGISGSIGFDENGDRLPPGVNSLEAFVDKALADLDASAYLDLGLVPCQVQNGKLVNLLGPDSGEIIFPE